MQRPLLGYLDPRFVAVMDECVDRLRQTWLSTSSSVMPLSATGTTAMEAGIAALVEPNDVVIVGVNGFFGRRLAEIARRHGAEVMIIEAQLGQAISLEMLEDRIRSSHRVSIVALVHAETSTGVRQPLDGIGALAHENDALFILDCVTSLGGIPVNVDEWGVDYAYSCSQKCLGAPPGLAPVALSEAARARIRDRETPLPFATDFELLARYWLQRPPTYHHTPPALQIYALNEALGALLHEGLQQSWERHACAGTHLQDGLRSRGFELLAEPDVQLPQLTAVKVPSGIDHLAVRTELRGQHRIEIGGPLDPASPPIWRIGLMGVNATLQASEEILTALDAVIKA